MAAKLRSIQGERQKKANIGNVKCRAFQKHDFDGHVFQEKVKSKTVWIARLECATCGTHRIDVMKPRTCELISRLYIHPDDYDGKLSPAQARKLVFKHMLENGVSLASLTG